MGQDTLILFRPTQISLSPMSYLPDPVESGQLLKHSIILGHLTMTNTRHLIFFLTFPSLLTSPDLPYQTNL